MFIKQLYHYNKYWLAVFLCFILFFFYINYKWGVVATPVYQYGMFSGKYSMQDTLTVYKILIDGKETEPATMHFTKRDMLLSMAEKYRLYHENPARVYLVMQRVFSTIGLGKLTALGAYMQTIAPNHFAKWMLEYSAIDGKNLQVLEQHYLKKGESLQAISNPQTTIIETY